MAVYGPRSRNVSVMNPYAPSLRFAQNAQSWYIQKPVSQAPLEYHMERSTIAPQSRNQYSDSPNHLVTANIRNSGPLFSGRENSEALNKCYEKFKGKVYDNQAQWAVNLVEWRQAEEMIFGAANTCRRAWNALRRGNFWQFLKELNLPREGKRWSKPNEAAKKWLQYHFGWEPLFNDIYESCLILEKTLGPRLVVARATKHGDFYRDGKYVRFSLDVPGFYIRYLMQAKVEITNPNLHRATSLGLMNPLEVVWEVLPFSFVVDWFIPIGTFLNSFCPFFGLALTDSFTTRSAFGHGRQWQKGTPDQDYGECSAWRVDRTYGISGPAFPVPKTFKGFSPTRGATAISLLVQALDAETKRGYVWR
jgi:hypothetical protein